MKNLNESLNKLKKGLKFKKFHSNIDSVDYEELDNYNNNYDFADDDKYRKIGSTRTLFKEFDSDYYKPVRTDDGFAGRKNNYIECKSNLSPKEYLDMIRPYLRDLINNHKTSMESNNNNSNSNDNSNSNNNNSNNTGRAEWEIELIMQDTRTKYSASKPVEIYIVSDTENALDTLFNTILGKIQQAIETSNEGGSRFTHESVALLYYCFRKIEIRRGESNIMSPDWIESKKATINSKNERR